AQELIRSKTATIDDVIGSRDDIMQYLIAKGQPGPEAFKIMEKVRKGKGVTEEEAARMKEFNVPDWYIESCRKIKYMFPKAHSVAYTLMSYRIAYYKVYYPQAFYAATFSGRIATFNMPVILGGIDPVLKRMDEIAAKGKSATKLEEEEVVTLELAYEMYARGYEFLPVSLDKSAATKFYVEDGKVRLSLQAIAGLGETAAKSIEDARKDGPFRSVEDLQNRTKGLSSTLIDALRDCGALGSIPDTDQLSLF
ncbi:MAG: helix-hairpin-helix domain-containing protein, partial [Firmicutes bacterium]|nr:helix-hairpin-helix domain-containing protein [Bacillota bacterium]